MTLAIAAFLGALTWSFMEYCIHRWLGHDRRFMPNFFGEEHTAHHSKGNYFAPTWKKLASAAVTAGVLIGPAVWVAGPWVGSAYVVGLVGFYLYYEVLHRLEHVRAGRGLYGKWARKHHFYHHFHDPKVNHGVTSPLWDIVFGTLATPSVIEVPPKLAMVWLCDPETGDVWTELSEDYRLRRKRASRAGVERSAG